MAMAMASFRAGGSPSEEDAAAGDDVGGGIEVVRDASTPATTEAEDSAKRWLAEARIAWWCRMRVVAAATCAPARVYANRLDARVRCNDILHVQRPPIREQFENLLDKLTRRCV
jgi:hypothetical protein